MSDGLSSQRFVVRLWCPDCYGEDHLGCFDGGMGTVHDDDGIVHVFETPEEATEAGYGAVRDTIWEFRVETATEDGG